MSGSVSSEYQEALAILRLSDPKTRNAMSISMVETFRTLLTEAVPRSRAILITGAGQTFCSGANLGGDLDPSSASYDAGAILESHFNPLMRTLRDCPLPIVSAVGGVAAGIGCALALSGDIIVAGESASFLQAFQEVGLVPDGGSATLLTRSIGRARALEMMLLGEKLPAPRALEWGLISRVVPDALLLAETTSLGQRLARGPTAALSMIKRQAWLAYERDHDAMLALERELQREAGSTIDHREGVAAFLAKETAIFVGR
jgi:2-(1,2-epoxy-1,2-dihydrophenyl)acetyl-CoA isomerase